MTAPEGFFGQQGITDNTDLYNAIWFLVHQALREVRTGYEAKVVAVHGGGVGPAPTVDIQPVVNQVDGQGNQTPHGIIYGIPVSRSQGGAAGVIMDPVVGDIGHVTVSDRDISALKANQGEQSNPGSKRTHNMADGTYVGATLNAVNPIRYINLNGPGIHIVDEFGNSIQTGANGVNINGLIIDLSGNLTTPGSIQAGTGTGDSITLQHHTHGGSPPPDPGT